MIDQGYSDEAIVVRLRHPIEVIQAVHKEIELEKAAKHHVHDDDIHDDDDWGEDYG